MDDSISRQAAINALENTECELLPEEWDELTDAIMNVPPAQPDGIPLEWIDKHIEWLDNCGNDFAQLAKVGIRAMVEIWKKDKT